MLRRAFASSVPGEGEGGRGALPAPRVRLPLSVTPQASLHYCCFCCCAFPGESVSCTPGWWHSATRQPLLRSSPRWPPFCPRHIPEEAALESKQRRPATTPQDKSVLLTWPPLTAYRQNPATPRWSMDVRVTDHEVLKAASSWLPRSFRPAHLQPCSLCVKSYFRNSTFRLSPALSAGTAATHQVRPARWRPWWAPRPAHSGSELRRQGQPRMYSIRSAPCACFIGNRRLQYTFTVSFNVPTSVFRRGQGRGLLGRWRSWWAPRLARSGLLKCSNARGNLICVPKVSPPVLELLPRPAAVSARTDADRNRLDIKRHCDALFVIRVLLLQLHRQSFPLP